MTRHALRLVVVAGVITALGALTACKRDAPPDTAAPSSPPPSATAGATVSASPTAAPATPTSPAPDPATVFAADGIGSYVIGTALSDLQGRGLVTNVFESQLCDNAKGAEATGRYAGALTFSFSDNRLIAVHTTSSTLVTPSGARIGMTVPQLQSVYGSRGTLITGTLGNKAYVVRVPASGLGIVFYLDPSNTRVASMSGGEAQPLEDAARNGEGC